MGFRTTMKCPQKGKKKVWVEKNCKGLSEILIKQSSPQCKISIYCTTESNLILDLDFELLNRPINKTVANKYTLKDSSPLEGGEILGISTNSFL